MVFYRSSDRSSLVGDCLVVENQTGDNRQNLENVRRNTASAVRDPSLVLMLSLCVLQVGIRVSREFSPISWWTLSAGLLVGAAIGWKQRFRRVPALQVVTSMGFITILGLIMENVFMSGGPWKQSTIERGILGVRDTVIQIVVWGGIAWIASWLLVGRKSTHSVG